MIASRMRVTRGRLVGVLALMVVFAGTAVPAASASTRAGPSGRTAPARTDGAGSTDSANDTGGTGHAGGAGSPLTATLLPAAGSAEGSQLAVSWHGQPGARLSVALRRPGRAATVLAADHALDTGANLVALRTDPGATGVLRLGVRDRSGAALGTWDEPLSTLRATSGFAWQSTFSGPGLASSVHATAVFDDGHGPALYVGGGFVTAGTRRVNGIARWDGADWSPLTGPSGTGVDGVVVSLTLFEGTLIVGGSFTTAGGVPANNVAQWNGVAWSALGDGVSDIGVGSATVQALALFGGDLIAGGAFTAAGGAPVDHIARWNGTAWFPLGSGTSSNVQALTVFSGKLIAGGLFFQAGGVTVNGVAQWDGLAWSALVGPSGTGVDLFVSALVPFQGALIVGGDFDHAGGVPASGIARWTGATWTALGTGTEGAVNALTVFNGNLIASGFISQAGGVTVNGIAQWNGTAWSALVGPQGTGPSHSDVATLVVFDARLVAGGTFARAGGHVVNNIATWDGTAWSALNGPASGLTDGDPADSLGQVHAITVFDGDLVVGGRFRRAGSDVVFSLARWDGTSWSPLAGPGGTGVLEAVNVRGSVDALTVFDGKLVIGGFFLQVGGVFATDIATWDGTTWSPLGTGINGDVRALTASGGKLVAAGNFDVAGGVSVSNIASWDGTVWSPLAAGVNGSVQALTTFGGDLVAGGFFTQAGRSTVGGIARWDGTSWFPLGTGTDGSVRALTVSGGDLVAGGSFTQAGGAPAGNIATWDGTAWSPLGTGTDGLVNALTVFNGVLVVGGSFDQAGGVPAANIASWDGTTWSPLGTGISGASGFGVVSAVESFDPDGAGPDPTELAAGGLFELAGGLANWSIALYGPVG